MSERANAERGEHSLKWGEAEFRLRPTMGAMWNIEDRLSITISDVYKTLATTDFTIAQLFPILEELTAGGGKAIDEETFRACADEGHYALLKSTLFATLTDGLIGGQDLTPDPAPDEDVKKKIVKKVAKARYRTGA